MSNNLELASVGSNPQQSREERARPLLPPLDAQDAHVEQALVPWGLKTEITHSVFSPWQKEFECRDVGRHAATQETVPQGS